MASPHPPFRIIYTDRFCDHSTGAWHPENAGRLRAVVTALRSHRLNDCLDWQQPSTRDPLPWIQQVHGADYLATLEQITARGGGRLDGDTPLSADSYAVAQLAVAAWLDAVDYSLETDGAAFVLARPPGHHAEQHRGMGFCLLSNAAIAARYALTRPGVQRVAILDWDVHHGNGTQQLVESCHAIAYCSLHQMPGYPGTGAAEDTGQHRNVCNIPMAPGSRLEHYQQRFTQQVLPFLQGFEPDLLIVSAGYDATAADPLASVCLEPEDYGSLTEACKTIAPRLLFGLEGGYDYSALGESVIATVSAAMR